MKMLMEKKKLFALIAMICFAAVFCTTAIGVLSDTVGRLNYMFNSFGEFLLSASYICASFLGALTIACYAGAAFFQWKKDDHKKILALAGICTMGVLFMGLVYQIIFFIVYDYFRFNILVSLFFGDIMPFLFAAFLIALSLLKIKGPAVPIAGAVLIALLCGSGILGTITSLVNYFSIVRYFSWDVVWNVVKMLFQGGKEIILCAGLLLLVPMAFYIPKEEPELISEESPIAE